MRQRIREARSTSNVRCWMLIGGMVLMTVLVAACGGRGEGGSDDGSGSDGANSGDGEGSVELTAGRADIPSSGNVAVDLTATVKDTNNVVREGVSVNFSADSGELQVTNGTTDNSGEATATLSSGSNQQERTITVTSSIPGGATDRIQLRVAGNNIGLTGPSSISAGEDGTFVATLTDSAGDGINNVQLSAETDSGATVTPATARTDSQGRVTFSVDAAPSGTSDRLTVEGSGITQTIEFGIANKSLAFVQPSAADRDDGLAVNTNHTVEIELTGSDFSGDENVAFQTTRGRFVVSGSNTTTTNAAGGVATVQLNSASAGPATVSASALGVASDISFDFVGTTPDAVTLTSESAQIPPNGSTPITALVKDPAGNPVADATIDFAIDADPSQGSLSQVSAVTDKNGEAQTVFTAGSTISGQNGVKLSGTVRGTPISDNTALTVSGTALGVSLGTGNEISSDTTTYSQPWTVVVTNSTGAPAANREVTVNVVPLEFFKGQWTAGTDRYVTSDSAVCPNEDTDFDNSIDTDTGEDADGDDNLEPDLPSLSTNSLTTGSDGRASFDLTYPKSEAQWVSVRLEVSVENSAGTAFTDSSEIRLVALASDVEDTSGAPPGGQADSPYGTDSSCSSPN